METQEKINEKPLGVLFNVLAYNSIEEFEDYLDRVKNKSQQDMLLTIHSALRYAQSTGIFSLEESEIISLTLRNLKTV
jgi:hypothetical protein